MSLYQIFSGSGLIANTEWSLSTNTAGPDFQNSSGVYQVFINTSGLLTGDEYTIKLYERTTNINGDLALPTYINVLVGPQNPPIWVSPSLILGNLWDITMVNSGVPGRNIFWSIRQAS